MQNISQGLILQTSSKEGGEKSMELKLHFLQGQDWS